MTASTGWRAWTTDVRLVVARPRDLRPAAALLRERMAAVGAAADRFCASSELRRLRPGRQPISDLLEQLLAAALRAAAVTDGLVDPTLGEQLALVGYDRTLPDLPADGAPAVARPAHGSWTEVELDAGNVTVPPGIRLDLGATAKAWLVDDVCRRLAQHDTRALVSVGGDLASSAPPGARAWPVAVGDPGGPVQTVAVGAALATSSTARRTWRRGGQRLHHVLDPRTGAPAAPCWRTVSVAAATCVDANTASTAAVVLGPDAPQWLSARRLPALLVGLDSQAVCVAGWPSPDGVGRTA